MIEFKHSGLPKTEEELKAHLEEIRSAVAVGGKATEEAIQKIGVDLERAMKSVEKADEAVQIARNAEEIAKAASRAGRTDEDKVERALKMLPMTYEVNKDEDFVGSGVSAGHFNILCMDDAELRLYLGDDTEAYRAAKRVRKLNDTLLTADAVLRRQESTGEIYRRNGGIKSLRMYAPYREATQPFVRALDTATSGNVSEWSPTRYSAELMTDVRDRLTFAKMFDWTPMPTNPWQYPILTTFMESYLAGEATSDAQATTFRASDVGSAGSLLTAKKHSGLCWLSRELDQDALFPLVPKLNAEHAYAIAKGWDKMVCNGQLTAAIDTDAAIQSYDVRNGANGFRYGAKLTTKQVDFGGTSVAVDGFAAMIGKAGKYAQDSFFATGYAGLARILVLKDSAGNAVLLTREKAGDAATMFSGTVGVLLGLPLVVSGMYPNNNMNASGVIDGVGGSTKTGVHLVNPKMYLGGLRQSIQIEANDNPGWLADQKAIKSTARIAMSPVITPSATYCFVVEGVNVGGY